MIRAFEKEDTISVANIARKAFEHSKEEGYYDQPGLTALLDEFDSSIHSEQELYDTLLGAQYFYVFEEMGRIMGFIRGSSDRLRTLAVHPAFQGKGIGKKLVEDYEQWAKDNGTKLIEIHAAIYSYDFYKKMGYEKQGEVSEFKGLNIYNMSKAFTHKEKTMKRFTILIDGMADRAQEILGGKTPMEAANKQGLDALFEQGRPGTVLTIPPGQETGSAVANMSLLGYNPLKVYRGRAVIEAAGAGIPVVPGNLYIRCNLVTLSGDSFDDSVMESYSAHDIETVASRPLIDRLNEKVFGGGAKLINTDSFRNILVVEGKADIAQELDFMPPHDMIGMRAGDYSKGGGIVNEYYDMMKKAYDVLSKDNDTKANAVWFWGASYAPSFGEPSKQKRVILAETTLMRGIAALSGTDCISTDESSGFVQFLKGKKDNAIKALKEYDYAYIHIQKLDDLSHELMPKEKTKALEQIDKYFVRPFFKELEGQDISCVIASDHFTFSDSGGHGGQPAPFILVGHESSGSGGRFTERNCEVAGFNLTAGELFEKQMEEI